MSVTKHGRTVRAAVAVVTLGAAMVAGGCSVDVGNVTKVPQYTQVEAQGVTLEVLDGMVESDTPSGFDVFWQNHDGSTLVSVGITLFADEEAYTDERIAWIEGSMEDFTTSDAGGGDVAFSGTGVDDATYTGLVGVRDGVGVMVSAGDGTAETVASHIVDSVQVSDAAASADEETADDAEADDWTADDEAAADDGVDDTDFPATTMVEAGDILVDVLEGMEEHPSDMYDGLWQTPAGVSPQVTISVNADVDPATYFQEQVTAISAQMQDPVQLDETEDRFVFEGTGVDGQTYTVVVGVNGTTGVVASSGPGLDESVLRTLVDRAW